MMTVIDLVNNKTKEPIHTKGEMLQGLYERGSGCIDNDPIKRRCRSFVDSL